MPTAGESGRAMQFNQRHGTWIVLAAFSLVYLFLAVTSYTRESATWDEPQHLTAGYAALTQRDYRIDPENPPLLDMWAALPLLFSRDVAFEGDQLPIEESGQLVDNTLRFCHRFLYRLNDADRLLYRARFMIVLLGLLLGVLVFCWARDLLGWRAGCAALVLYALEPNLLAHARLVTTDFGVTCFIFGTIYFLWRTTRRLSLGNVLGLCLFFLLAQATKFTALLLAPTVAVLLLIPALGSRPWPFGARPQRDLGTRGHRMLAALLIVLVLLALGYMTLWALYSFRYAPTPAPVEQARFETSRAIAEIVPALAAAAGWIDRHHLLPNACSQGFLYGQAKARIRAESIGEAYRISGIWYYFPMVFVLKTPLLLLILILTGVVLYARLRRDWVDAVFILLPAVVFLSAAMGSGLNVCLRHILPVYPFALLLAARSVAPLLVQRWRVLVGILALVGLGEFATIYPHYLACFSELIGGPSQGYRYMADSSLDWGQDLKGLKRWMDDNGVRHINLTYFGSADPAYYGIPCTLLSGTNTDFSEVPIERPRLPGYVAVSVTHLRGVYLGEQGRAFYRPLLEMKPYAVIGHSIHVYWIEQEWWDEPDGDVR